MMRKIRIELNGIFNRQLIRKTITVNLPETVTIGALPTILSSHLNLDHPLEGSPIILLNGRRIDSKEIHLTNNDTLSFLSPLTGG
jgi:molybdopterin converting factor small subunit